MRGRKLQEDAEGDRGCCAWCFEYECTSMSMLRCAVGVQKVGYWASPCYECESSDGVVRFRILFGPVVGLSWGANFGVGFSVRGYSSYCSVVALL